MAFSDEAASSYVFFERRLTVRLYAVIAASLLHFFSILDVSYYLVHFDQANRIQALMRLYDLHLFITATAAFLVLLGSARAM